MGPCFVIFAEEFRRDAAKQHGSLMGCYVGGPRAEVQSAEGVGKTLDAELEEGQ